MSLTEGDWVEVKRTLNTGDTRRLEGAGLKPPVMVGDKIISPIDWSVYEIERAFIYLTDWSICGADERVLPLTIDSIKALEPESFNEINKAILQYRIEQEKAKNPPMATATPTDSTKTDSTSDASASATT